ncbi:hypothetical protein [Nocardioides mangrovi]|uniref:DUF3099 domain-containing protein n=1 Tax=Nocardioides mangrovi TaxID=2874580 RepID=A0ABS7UDC7_9ACTN|nr:hypothetical protein [Nocardioides mangrovi]MBZ5738830.1 hypothetical protein [Nocardioides mangrovi]
MSTPPLRQGAARMRGIYGENWRCRLVVICVVGVLVAGIFLDLLPLVLIGTVLLVPIVVVAFRNR